MASLATGIRISPTGGLEVSLLSEIYQKASVNRICQVEIAEARCVAPLRSSVPTRPAYRCCRLGCGSPPL